MNPTLKTLSLIGDNSLLAYDKDKRELLVEYLDKVYRSLKVIALCIVNLFCLWHYILEKVTVCNFRTQTTAINTMYNSFILI
jgi:hypothetical protein